MAGVFKKNDIRGVVGEDLTEDFAEKLGYIFGQMIGQGKNVSIGGDTRQSTELLKNGLALGLQKAGVNVYDLGVGPTPMTYFVGAHFDHINESIMVTGSHNPPDHNGIKISDGKGQSYHYGNLYESLERQLGKFTVELPKIKPVGSYTLANDLKQAYYDFLKTSVAIENQFKILVDYGKGATFQFGEVLDHLGVKYVELGANHDGTFDGPPPDPAKPHTFNRMKETMDDELLGIAFDTDGDRVGFITKDKQIISPDKVAMLLAESVKTKQPHPKVIIDVKVSKATAEYVESIGGSVDLSQVGHSYIHEKLMHENADIAAELSGHYYFNDRYYGFDDGLYTAIRFLEVIDKQITDNIDPIEKIKSLPNYSSTPEFRDYISYDTIDKILTDLEELVNEEGGDISKIDGIRAEFNDGWFLARKSGTEEILSYRIEGDTPEARDRILAMVQSIIEKY